MEITFGTDAEFAVVKDHRAIPAALANILPEPTAIEGRFDTYIHDDSGLAELTSKAPIATAEETPFGSISDFLESGKTAAENTYACELNAYRPFIVFDEDVASHETMLELGCNPDVNIFSDQKQRASAAFAAGTRTLGGHLHIRMPNTNIRNRTKFIQGLSMWFFCMQVHAGTVTERQIKRWMLYGLPGSVRVNDTEDYLHIEFRQFSTDFWVEANGLRELSKTPVESKFSVEFFDTRIAPVLGNEHTITFFSTLDRTTHTNFANFVKFARQSSTLFSRVNTMRNHADFTSQKMLNIVNGYYITMITGLRNVKLPF